MEEKGSRRDEGYRHIFIAGDTYQVMQAVSWAEAEGTHVTIYCTDPSIRPAVAGNAVLRTILPYDVYRPTASVVNTRLTQAQYLFFRDMYARNTVLHVFGNTQMWFARGYTDVHLHEAGDSSYTDSEYGVCGDDDPHTVACLHLTRDPGKPYGKRCRVNKLFHKGGVESAALLLNVDAPPVPNGDTILLVHNEPDTVRYTEDEIVRIHDAVGELVRDMKAAGYTVWVKDHHKRGGRCDLTMADMVIGTPIELIDTDAFKHIVSVRSKCVEDLPNGFNGLTREAVTKCKAGFMHAYTRGIEKLRKYMHIAG